MSGPADLLRQLFTAAVAAADPDRCLPPHVPAPVRGRTHLIGAGKAAASMARAFTQHYSGPVEGLVVVPDGYGVDTDGIGVMFAGHPVPDARSILASRRILDCVTGLGEHDRVVCLLSGGGSSLLCLPPNGVSLDDKRALTAGLLRSGAPISEINCVRSHLSRIKGGRLAASCFPAPCLTLVISDVPGDDPTLIASGPTAADVTSRDDARGVLSKYGLTDSEQVMSWLADARSESIKPGDPRIALSDVRCVARSADALTAAASAAEALGIEPTILGDDLEGEAREVASEHAASVRAMIARESRPACPRVLLSGGETSVTVTGDGRGGRNGEYLLALAISLEHQSGVHALACDTDGIDGSGHNAGAIISPDTLDAAGAAGTDPWRCLKNNDAFTFFEAVGGLVVTGPTLTNVNDFRAILVLPEAWDFNGSPRL